MYNLITENLQFTPPHINLDQPFIDSDNELLVDHLTELTNCHYKRCHQYKNIIDNIYGGLRPETYGSITDIPFIPVNLFKRFELYSCQVSEIIKTMTSSGTTSSSVSKIFLDGYTARIQSAALIKIMQTILGKQRLPMIVLDCESCVKNRLSFSARGAGILGMLQFGFRPFYAYDEEMNLKLDQLLNYLADLQSNQPVFLFGFTFMVWQYFVVELEKLAKNSEFDISDLKEKLREAILVHSGGWKKLTEHAVSAKEFRERLSRVSGINKCYNFYGMVEQVGSIFLENDSHLLRPSKFGSIIIRDPLTLAPLEDGKVGLIQVLSILPWSYPGHSILTEDLGVIKERKNNIPQFEVLGRIPKSESRGCSDTFTA